MNYSEVLLQEDHNALIAIKLLENAKKVSQSAEIYSLLGYSYFSIADYNNAIKSYIFLSNLVPSKFEFKLRLMESYRANNDLNNAKIIANKILSMPIKIPSEAVDLIKQQAKTILLIN